MISIKQVPALIKQKIDSIWIFDRYIGKVVVLATLVSLLVIVSLDAFFAFIGEVDTLGRGDYSLGDAIIYVLLTVPRRMYEFFPMAALLGSLLGMGSLATHSELIVMRAVGFSMQRIIKSVIGAGVVLMCLAILIGEVIAPIAEQYAQRGKDLAQSNRITMSSRHGFWARDGESFINIREIIGAEVLKGIYVYEFDKQRRLRLASFASKATFVNDEWLLEGVKQSFVSSDGVITNQMPSARWESLLDPGMLNVVVVKPENLSTWDLARYVSYMKENQLDPERYQLAFWVRVVSPFSALVMLLLAMPFVFGPLRSVGAGQRIFVGVLVGIVFMIFNKTFNHLGQVYSMPPFLSAVIPTLVFLAIGAYFVWRMSSYRTSNV